MNSTSGNTSDKINKEQHDIILTNYIEIFN